MDYFKGILRTLFFLILFNFKKVLSSRVFIIFVIIFCLFSWIGFFNVQNSALNNLIQFSASTESSNFSYTLGFKILSEEDKTQLKSNFLESVKQQKQSLMMEPTSLQKNKSLQDLKQDIYFEYSLASKTGDFNKYTSAEHKFYKLLVSL